MYITFDILFQIILLKFVLLWDLLHSWLAISNKNVMNNSIFYTYVQLILVLLNKLLFQLFGL